MIQISTLPEFVSLMWTCKTAELSFPKSSFPVPCLYKPRNSPVLFSSFWEEFCLKGEDEKKKKQKKGGACSWTLQFWFFQQGIILFAFCELGGFYFLGRVDFKRRVSERARDRERQRECARAAKERDERWRPPTRSWMGSRWRRSWRMTSLGMRTWTRNSRPWTRAIPASSRTRSYSPRSRLWVMRSAFPPWASPPRLTTSILRWAI